jgi:CRISPR/Cas system-associated exonuclease Cas4 (RecB family)
MRLLISFLRRIARRSSRPLAHHRWHSVSSSSAYEECPRRYQFAYVDRVPEPRTQVPESWRFGTVVHAGLEVGYQRHRDVGFSQNLAHTIPAARYRAERVVGRSLANTRLWPAEILGVEHFFRTVTPEGLRIAGAADLVLKVGADGVEIRDHKVTRYVRTPEQLVSDFQLNLYGWLAQQTWPWAQRVFVSHHYPLMRSVVRVELDQARVAETIERLRATAGLAEADVAFAPTPGAHCSRCAYRGHCDAAQLAA